VIVVTGASRGVGAALVAHYRAAGREVAGTARGAGAEIRLDVTNPEDHAAMARQMQGRPVELLVCNAGVFLDRGHRIEDGYAADLWSQTFATNVTGVFLAVQALLPNLRQAESAKIAIVASQMASSELAPGGSYI
jgi:NADP-dependent 3-hydroxy acid dehydrogenase YdfG